MAETHWARAVVARSASHYHALSVARLPAGAGTRKLGRCGHSSRPQTPEALLARSNSTALTRIGKAAATAELATTSTTISDELVTTARRLVRELMRALRWEARDVLGDELLRDDVIVIDQESG